MLSYCLENYSDQRRDLNLKITTHDRCEQLEIYPISQGTIEIEDMTVEVDALDTQEFEIHTYQEELTDYNYLCGSIEYVIEEGHQFISFTVDDVNEKVLMIVEPDSTRDPIGSYSTTLAARFYDLPSLTGT